MAKKVAKKTTAKKELRSTARIIPRIKIGTSDGDGGGGSGGNADVVVTWDPELLSGVPIGDDVRMETNARIRITSTVTAVNEGDTFTKSWRLRFTRPDGSEVTRPLENHDVGETMIREFVANDQGDYRVTMEVKKGTRKVWTSGFSVSAVAAQTLQQISGRLTFLRVHEGGGFGPPDDHIPGDVIVKVDSAPEKAFGFALRTDGWQPVHHGMLDILRTAFEHDFRVTLDHSIIDGKRHGTITRVALSK
jgi:hypothetical protein